MSDDTKTPVDLTAAQADFLATRPETTYRDLLAAGAGVYGFVKEHYSTRLAALEAADRAWVASGRPASVRPIAPPATAREPIPPPPPDPAMTIAVPRPEDVPDLRTLARHGAAIFNGFAKQHPAAFEAMNRKEYGR